MSLHVYSDITQSTPEWDDLRRGMVTASVVGQLVTPSTLKPASNPASRNLAALLVAERVTGWTEPTFMSDDMMRGVMDEPRAREMYAETRNVSVQQVGFMVRHEEWGELGYSPDGLVPDDGLIEVKSRAPKKHLQTILADDVPAENMAQIQGALLVSGREWCDYISYTAGMPMWVRRVYPDPDWHKAIRAAVRAFEEAAVEMVKNYRAAITGLPVAERVERIDPYMEATI